MHVLQAVVALREQFRMNADIMALSNTLVYSGQLRCGSTAVAEASLALPRPPAAGAAPPWLLEVLTRFRLTLTDPVKISTQIKL